MESQSQNLEFRNNPETFTNVNVKKCTGLFVCLYCCSHMTYPVFIMLLKYKVAFLKLKHVRVNLILKTGQIRLPN